MFGHRVERELGEIRTKLDQVHSDVGDIDKRVRGNERLLWQFIGGVILISAVVPLALSSGALSVRDGESPMENPDARLEASGGGQL